MGLLSVLGSTAQNLTIYQVDAILELAEAYKACDSLVLKQTLIIERLEDVLTAQSIEIETQSNVISTQSQALINYETSIGKQEEVSEHFNDLYKSEKPKKLWYAAGGLGAGLLLGLILGR